MYRYDRNRFFRLFTILFFSWIEVTISIYGQMSERLYQSDFRIDPDRKGELRLETDNLSFFKNNEFSNYFMKGYTLPGFWIQPKFVYYPLENVKLEAGIHALCYWGADAYPNSAYQDIAKWKSDRYQLGCHLLPYFRAQMNFSDNVTIVLGNLYGGANHRIIEPLYVPELNLTADPETGLQLIWQAPAVQLDAWVNWDSFIFYRDYHQEVFTVGLSSRLQVNRPESSIHVYFPIQGLIQHRGGEMLEIESGLAQTLLNGAAGVGFVWNANRKVLKNIELESEIAGYYQHSGSLWHVDNGTAFYARTAIQLTDFRIKTSFWKSKDFMSLFGYTFYGAASSCYENLTCPSHRLIHWGAEYSHTFGKGYSIGFNVGSAPCQLNIAIHSGKDIQ
ncbi:MAG: hypothetical protein LUE98_15560 [Tannerellaceae bacterium]|nr:hypothetical protein [Tannerellaceae bacterium]